MSGIAVTVLAWIGAIWLTCALAILGAAIYLNRQP